MEIETANRIGKPGRAGSIDSGIVHGLVKTFHLFEIVMKTLSTFTLLRKRSIKRLASLTRKGSCRSVSPELVRCSFRSDFIAV